MIQIDLNCDMGELPETIADGSQESLMPWLTSVNIACGGHAGDAQMMEATIRQAIKYNLAIGAHPGYPDRKNFGRKELQLSPAEVSEFVYEQVCALVSIAEPLGARIRHVKPHGALYNQMVYNSELASAIAEGVARWKKDVVLVVLAGSPTVAVFRGAGFAVAAEAFADRLYEPDGTLRARKFDDALLRDPQSAGRQAVNIATRGKILARGGQEISVNAQTLCIHGDTPGSNKIAAAAAKALKEAGVAVRPL
jgi:UPF0271 protein